MMPKILVLSLLVVFSGFVAADEIPPQPAEQLQVEQRARAYLDALKLRDLHTVYRMESGALDGTLTADAFHRRIKSTGAVLLDYQIRKVSLEESGKATVEFDATYQYSQLHEPTTMPNRSQWVLIEGQWYRAVNHDPSKMKVPSGLR